MPLYFPYIQNFTVQLLKTEQSNDLANEEKSVDENLEDLATSFCSEISERCKVAFSNKSRVNRLYAKKKPEELSWRNFRRVLKNILDVQSCVVKSHTAFPTHSLHMYLGIMIRKKYNTQTRVFHWRVN